MELKKIVLCTFSNVLHPKRGDSVNDYKLLMALPREFKISVVYPKYFSNGKLTIKGIFYFLKRYISILLEGNCIIITRGSKLALIPSMFGKLLNIKTLLRLGCTPLMFIERAYFNKNEEYKKEYCFLQKIYHNYFEPFIEISSLIRADKIMVENTKAKKIVELNGAKRDNVFINPYYINDYFKNYTPIHFDVNKNSEFHIGYTGRFQDYDLLNPVLDSIEILNNNKKTKVILNLVGDGPNRKKMEDYVRKRKINKYVNFLGRVPHKKVADLMDQFHLLVLPMLQNINPSTLAIKILEGVSKGKIIITSKSGNNASLFLEHQKLVIENLSSEILANKIAEVIQKYSLYTEISMKIQEYHNSLRSINQYKKKIYKEIMKLSNK